jgi:hypothetical protein
MGKGDINFGGLVTGVSDQGLDKAGMFHAKTLSTPGRDGKQGGGICGSGDLREDLVDEAKGIPQRKRSEGEGKAFFAKRNGRGSGVAY